MYLTNKYSIWYYNIINRAKSRISAEYTEKHHIIPKSLGGSNDPSNLISLTAKEHFICHLLLTKMTVGLQKTKMVQAAWMMTMISSNQYRYKINGKTYQILKEQMSLAKKGLTTWNKGITPSDETKKKLRDANLDYLVKQNKITEEEAIIRKSYPLNFEHDKEKMPRKVANGWKWSDEAKQKLSESRKGRIPWNKGKGRI